MEYHKILRNLDKLIQLLENISVQRIQDYVMILNRYKIQYNNISTLIIEDIFKNKSIVIRYNKNTSMVSILYSSNRHFQFHSSQANEIIRRIDKINALLDVYEYKTDERVLTI